MGLFDDTFDIDNDGKVDVWELDEIGMLDDSDDIDSDFDDGGDEW